MMTCTSSDSAVGATLSAALQFFAASQCLVQEPWPKQARIHNGSRFDLIIVGGGTAGSTLAARLADGANFTVLLVEAGGDPPQETIIPGFRDTLKGGPYDWNFTTVNDNFASQAFQGGSQHQPRGKMLGGSGSLNDMVYARGFPIDYDEWAQTLGNTWNWTNVLEYFKKTEQLTDEMIINNTELMKYHGRDGEIEVSGFNKSNIVSENLLEAFGELGFDIVDDMTYPHKIGAGRFSHTVRDGRRDSSLTALLNQVKSNNLYVLKNALTTKIIFANNTAIGIEVLFNGEELHLFADYEVILSAGTFNTPKLLLLSGIGPKDHLDDLGIDVIQDLPIGDNLHDHVMVLNYIATDDNVCSTDKASEYFDIIKYFYDRSGSLSRSDSVGAYITFDNCQPNVPDIALYPTCAPKSNNFYAGCISILGLNDGICSQLAEENKKHDLVTVAVVLLKPKSRGKVRLNPADPHLEPLIYSGTFSNPEDLDRFPDAMNIARSLVDTSYLTEHRARVIDITPDICKSLEGTDLLKCEAKALATSAWHAVGTASMGSVVDKYLQVIGVNNLRVVDASVMPKVIRGNTNAPVVMIAEKAADFIKELAFCPRLRSRRL